MKKGLSVVLEQSQGLRPPRTKPNQGGTTPDSQDIEVSGVESDNDVSSDIEDEEIKKDEVNVEMNVKERSALLLKGIKFFDGQSSKPMSFDEEAALNYVSSFLSELQKDKKLNDTNIDDLFVEYMVKFLTRNNKYPFKFEYDPKFYEISFSEVMENKKPVGLEKILVEVRKHLFEQPVGDNTGYIQYVPGSAGFAIVNPERGSADWDRVTSDYVRKTQTPIEDSQFTQTKSREEKPQQQTPEQPEQKRPEEEIGLSGKQIKDKAKVEGWAGIKEILKDSKYAAVKRVIEDKMREDYVLTFPGDETLDSYEVVDLVKLNPSVFEDLGIDSLPMYRMKKRSGDEIAQNLNNIIESGRVSKEFCKTAVKSFYELATDDYGIDIDSLKATALYLDRCRDQHGGKWGIGDVEFVDGALKKSGTQYRLDRMSQLSPEFRINFADNTVSGQKFK